MRIRFYNCRLLTMKGPVEVTQGEVWVDGPAITYVGRQKSTDEVFDREIDVQGNLLMPGFKNAHTHSAMTFLRMQMTCHCRNGSATKYFPWKRG